MFRIRRAAGLVALAGAGLVAAWSAPALAAGATEFVPDPDQATPNEMLTLASAFAAEPRDAQSISPGDPAYWVIRATQDDPSGVAEANLRLAGSGPLLEREDGLSVRVEECLVPWTGIDDDAPACAEPGAPAIVQAAGSLSPTPTARVDLTPLASDAPHYLLVTLALTGVDPSDEAWQGQTGSVSVGVTATLADAGAPAAPGDDALLPTGGRPIVAFHLAALVGAAALAAGGVALLRPRRAEA
ncbi:hypothetical protein [Microbacterium excoecariae]|uniref:hypothetical protein n=1 Tax=Microbacterium excoecariae TaxID=2715210 RepID=UPI001407996E|nr:hypothetical protein [Microbacterium excoecariae]NHI17811.1 hypothetical protein [Microbacterium excoecariae]